MNSRRDRAMGPLRQQASDDLPGRLYLVITGGLVLAVLLAAYTFGDNIELPPPPVEVHSSCGVFKPLTLRTYPDGTQKALYLCMGPIPDEVPGSDQVTQETP